MRPATVVFPTGRLSPVRSSVRVELAPSSRGLLFRLRWSSLAAVALGTWRVRLPPALRFAPSEVRVPAALAGLPGLIGVTGGGPGAGLAAVPRAVPMPPAAPV